MSGPVTVRLADKLNVSISYRTQTVQVGVGSNITVIYGGVPGPAGQSILYSDGVPSDDLGDNGQCCVDYSTWKIYGPKAAGHWPTPGTSLVGPVGKYWTDMPGSPARASDTQFTITDTGNANGYQYLFSKGTVLIWTNGSKKRAVVISSSYSSDTVTINIRGEALAAGFSSMKYCVMKAYVLKFPVVPFSLAVADDPTGCYGVAPFDLVPLSFDAFVTTAGTTNATTLHPTDDGSSLVSSDISIASGSTSSIDNAASSPSTAIAVGSELGIHITAVSTTPPIDLVVFMYCIPKSWEYL